MTNTKKSLVLSILSVLICLSMLIGTTFAWFTDTVTTGKNKIVAGTLDLEIYHTNAKVAEAESIENATNLWNKDVNGKDILWEPGVVSYETFTAENKGTLALTYKLLINQLASSDYNTVVSTDSSNGKSLKDVLYVHTVTGSAETTRPTTKMADTDKTIAELLSADAQLLSGSLDKGASSDKITVYIYWPTDSGNECNIQNGKSTSDGNPLFINLSVTATATQYTKESDSFDNQYDKTSTVANMPKAVTGLYYTGSAQTLISAGSTSIGTFKYAISETEPASDDAYSETLPKETNAGTYKIWYKVFDNPNYAGASAENISVTVSKIMPNVTAPVSNEPTYTGSPLTLVSAGSAVEGTINYALGTDAETSPESGWSTDIPTTTNAGTYYVWYKSVGNVNYENSEAACIAVNVKKATQTAPSAPESESITATAVTLSAASAGQGDTKYGYGTEDDSSKVTNWQNSTEFTGLNSGTKYYFFAKYEGNGNYNAVVSDSTEIVTKFTIAVNYSQDGNAPTATTQEVPSSTTITAADKVLTIGEKSYISSDTAPDGDFKYWEYSVDGKTYTAITESMTVTSDMTIRAGYGYVVELNYWIGTSENPESKYIKIICPKDTTFTADGLKLILKNKNGDEIYTAETISSYTKDSNTFKFINWRNILVNNGNPVYNIISYPYGNVTDKDTRTIESDVFICSLHGKSK